MTALAGSSTALSIPLTQNTAPVLEFRCLYTHDIRRKAKRWQDGFLKFHTFNKRVMVYDVPRNFIGDMHWQDTTSTVQDGDEVALERSGALVQVGEQVGLTETDLSGLLAKRTIKPVEGKSVCDTKSAGAKAPSQLQTRSSYIPPKTPTRWTGRANVPLESPFDVRHKVSAHEYYEEGPRAKRQRRDDDHVPLWELLKTSRAPKVGQILSAVNVMPTLVRTAHSRTPGKGLCGRTSTKNSTSLGQARLKVKEVVDLTSTSEDRVEDEHEAQEGPIALAHRREYSDVHSSSPPIKLVAWKRNQDTSQTRVTPSKEMNARVITESATEEQTTPRARSSRRTDAFPSSPPVRQYGSDHRCNDKPLSSPENCSDDALEPSGAPNNSPICTRSVKQCRTRVVLNQLRPKRSSPPSSPPVTANQVLSVDGTIPMTVISDPTHSDKARPKLSNRPMKPLRLTNHAPRKMLLCQTLGRTSPVKPPRPPSRRSNLNPLDKESLGTKPKGTKHFREAQPQRGRTRVESPRACSSPAFATQQAYLDATQPRQSNGTSARKLSRDDDATAPNISNDDPNDLLPQSRETLLPTNSITVPPYPKLLPPPLPRLKHKPPPDYSHLDAQLLFHPSLLPTTDPIVQPSHIQPSNIQPSEIQTPDSAPPVKILSPQRQSNRTLARALSDTAAANPPRRLKQAWRRAETIAHPGAAADAGRAQWQGRGQGQDKEKGKDKEEDSDVGPWSREAWDLFGWCPERKRGALGWGYGESGGVVGVEV